MQEHAKGAQPMGARVRCGMCSAVAMMHRQPEVRLGQPLTHTRVLTN